MIFLKFMDAEIYLDETTPHKFTDGAVLLCEIHGDIKSFSYDAYVEGDDLAQMISDHLLRYHF